MKVNLGTDVIVVDSTLSGSTGDATYAWEISELRQADSVLDAAFPTGTTSSDVVINFITASNLLQAGSLYTLRLSVISGGVRGSASLLLSANLPPSPGTCDVSPRVGTHLQVRVCMCMCVRACGAWLGDGISVSASLRKHAAVAWVL